MTKQEKMELLINNEIDFVETFIYENNHSKDTKALFAGEVIGLRIAYNIIKAMSGMEVE